MKDRPKVWVVQDTDDGSIEKIFYQEADARAWVEEATKGLSAPPYFYYSLSQHQCN